MKIKKKKKNTTARPQNPHLNRYFQKVPNERTDGGGRTSASSNKKLNIVVINKNNQCHVALLPLAYRPSPLPPCCSRYFIFFFSFFFSCGLINAHQRHTQKRKKGTVTFRRETSSRISQRHCHLSVK
jgi:hypothetical protein